MSKNIKIHPGKKQLSPEEIALIAEGLNLKKESIFGKSIIIAIKSFDESLRIAKSIEDPLFHMSQEKIYIYNNQGRFLKKIKLKNY